MIPEAMVRHLEQLPILEFASQAELRTWLSQNHSISPGIWIRIAKKASAKPSVSFEQVLDEGLCYGWSESTRRAYDNSSYLQKFSPRRTKGTTSERNRRRVKALTQAGKMTKPGFKALGLPP